MDKPPASKDRLLLDLSKLMDDLSAKHRYWEIRLHRSDNRIRLEVIFQGDTYEAKPPQLQQN